MRTPPFGESVVERFGKSVECGYMTMPSQVFATGSSIAVFIGCIGILDD
jgi:hypothetical protein